MKVFDGLVRKCNTVLPLSFSLAAVSLFWFGGMELSYGAGPPFPNVEWTREHSTPVRDLGYDVSADRLGNIFITGETLGNLGATNLGLGDAFISRYDASGNRLWTRHFGSGKADVGYGVAADQAGNAYLAGGVNGFWGSIDQATSQAFVTKYDIAGNVTWTRSFGSSKSDEARDVTVDALGNVFVTGLTMGDLAATNAGESDLFVSKFNAQGDLAWSRQIGSNRYDLPFAAASDGLGNVFITGATLGNFGGPIESISEDVFLAKFDEAGNHLWTRQIGDATQQWGQELVVDSSGNVFVAGITTSVWGGGNPNNSYDGFLVKFDANGDQQWLAKYGGGSADNGTGVALDDAGNIFVSGYSNSNLPGTDADGRDAFVMKFDSTGTQRWFIQGGPTGPDESYGLAADGRGSLYTVGGVLRGSFISDNYDLFLTKIAIPEPSAAVLLLTALGWAVAVRQRTW